MEENLIITEERFIDLLVLCMYWQGGDPSSGGAFAKEHTTISAITAVLQHLRLLTTEQRQRLPKDVRLQSALIKQVEKVPSTLLRIPSGTSRKDRVAAQKLRQDTLQHMQNSSRFFMVVYHPTKDFVRHNLLTRERFYLTPAGAAHAKAIEPKYTPFIRKEHYLSERKKYLRKGGK